MANKKSKQKKSGKEDKTKKSASKKRPKLVFVPIQRVRRQLIEHNYANRIGRRATGALCAILEYLTTELITLTGKIATESKTNRIRPRHIQLAARYDSEFDSLLQWATIADGGVLPTVN